MPSADTDKPFADEPSYEWPITDMAIREVFAAMLADGSWGRYHGPHCDAFRSALAEYHQVDHAILCCSGTAAVELALRSVAVGQGDEVILSAYDFKANFVNVLTLGAIPVLVDTIANTPVIDIEQLAAAVSDRTKAIVVSHLHGSLAPMQAICDFAKDRNIAVIEDACQSPGAIIDGRRAGTIGDVGVLSFGGSKLLTAGRGGAILTSDATIAQRIKLHTQRGNEAYPLSEMQAAVLLPQLKQLDARNLDRAEKAAQFFAAFETFESLRPAILSDLSPNGTQQRAAYYKTAFLLPPGSSDSRRERLCVAARQAGIPLDPAFAALHLIHSQRRFRAIGSLENATELHRRLTVLHHTAYLRSPSELSSMAARLMEITSSLGAE